VITGEGLLVFEGGRNAMHHRREVLLGHRKDTIIQ
jgi:hypothetical protein